MADGDSSTVTRRSWRSFIGSYDGDLWRGPRPDRDLFYLGQPYSSVLPQLREERFRLGSQAAGVLTKDEPLGRVHVISPIAHSHPIAEYGDTPGSWEFWSQYDMNILARLDGMFVLGLAGWDQSTGLTAEREFCAEHHIKQVFIQPSHLGLDTRVHDALFKLDQLERQKDQMLADYAPGVRKAPDPENVRIMLDDVLAEANGKQYRRGGFTEAEARILEDEGFTVPEIWKV